MCRLLQDQQVPPSELPDREPKKVRFSLRKNRTNKTRRNDLTRDVINETGATDGMAQTERVSGRGDLTRKRTIAGATTSGDQIILPVDREKCLPGRVISAIGSTQCMVEVADGSRYQCTVRKVVRSVARDARSAVVTGDHVWFEPAAGQAGVIERVEPRSGVLSRGHQYRQHVIVANITQIAVVGSANDPPLKPALIDRFLVSAGKGGVDAIICINKADLVDITELQAIVGTYARLGYEVMLTSVTTGYGLARLRSCLVGHQTVFTGQSGVGKSSLLNAIQPGLSLRIGRVSQVTQKGRHTTRYAELLKLNFAGADAVPAETETPAPPSSYVVDTPGIRQLDLWDVSAGEVEAYFVEFRPFVPFCKYPNCLHLEETDCAVRQAVQMDLISRLRYESYVRIVLGDES